MQRNLDNGTVAIYHLISSLEDVFNLKKPIKATEKKQALRKYAFPRWNDKKYIPFVHTLCWHYDLII